MSLSAFYSQVAAIAALAGNQYLEAGRTTFSRLSAEAQEAIVDAMLVGEGETVSVSPDVYAEVQAWANEPDTAP